MWPFDSFDSSFWFGQAVGWLTEYAEDDEEDEGFCPEDEDEDDEGDW